MARANNLRNPPSPQSGLSFVFCNANTTDTIGSSFGDSLATKQRILYCSQVVGLNACKEHSGESQNGRLDAIPASAKHLDCCGVG